MAASKERIYTLISVSSEQIHSQLSWLFLCGLFDFVYAIKAYLYSKKQSVKKCIIGLSVCFLLDSVLNVLSWQVKNKNNKKQLFWQSTLQYYLEICKSNPDIKILQIELC